MFENHRRRLAVAFLTVFIAAPTFATIFGTVRGIVRDPQGRAISGAPVVLHAASGEWQQEVATDPQGHYAFTLVPFGNYRVLASASGFAATSRAVAVTSGSILSVDLQVAVMARVSEQISVSAAGEAVDTRSPTTQTTVSRIKIDETPGASRTNSLSMITDFVPGAYVVHDQLHVRGGHQVTWMIDGIPVPNTNIAGNVGPQFDPKDIDYLEVQRGGMSAEYGDRTYAVFNVVPRTGFERSNESNVLLGAGTHRSSDGQVNIGSHTDRFAYYLSATANRSDAGLETPVPEIIHDQTSGAGLFSSLVFLPNAADQLRVAASARADSYQIPNDQNLDAQGVRDRQRERDAFVNASWLRTLSPSMLLTVAPFFHYNLADFEGGPNDPISTRDHRASRYLGLQTSLSGTAGAHQLRFGVFGFNQRDQQRFSLTANDGSGLALSQRLSPSGSVASVFAEDAIDVTPSLTLRVGARWTRYSGGVHETATTPRVGVAFRLPGSATVLRASYGQAYQPPPLATVSGPIEELAIDQGFGFLPLRGERDRSAEIGVAVPMAGWTVDAAAFRNHARNFFDHDALGNSNIFLPLTIDRVRIRGLEATITSPRLTNGLQLHAAFSHQRVEGEGAVTGGLTDFEPPEEGTFFLDHDQRDTASAGGTLQLGATAWAAAAISYGSGFLDGDGPSHLPSHTTFDLGAGKTFGGWSLKLTALNIANRRYLLDNSNTFGGTHYVEPREVIATVGWRFHY